MGTRLSPAPRTRKGSFQRVRQLRSRIAREPQCDMT